MVILMKYCVLSIAIASGATRLRGFQKTKATSHLVLVSPLHGIVQRLLITSLLSWCSPSIPAMNEQGLEKQYRCIKAARCNY